MAYSHTSLRNARSGNVKWTFRVALDRESYHAGDILQANVFLCVVEPLHCNGIMGCIRGEEKVTWSEKTSRRTGDEVYTRQNEFLNEKMIVATSRMYGPGEYVFPVVYQLHSTLPASFHHKFHPVGPYNSVHTQLTYVFHVCLNANQGVLVEAQQEIVMQDAVVPNRSLETTAAQSTLTPEDRLSTTLDKAAYRPGESLRLLCRNTTYRPSRNALAVTMRLYEDVSITVTPSQQDESKLLYERSFQIAAGTTTFELVLELPKVEQSFSSSFVNRRHRLTVESLSPNSNGVAKTDMALVIL